MTGWRSGPVFEGLARMVSRTQLRGRSHLPSVDADGPALVVINHTSPLDVVIMMAALRREGLWVDRVCPAGCAPGHRHFRVLATSDLLRFPVTRQMARRSGVIPVDASNGTSALLAARRALDEGEIVVLYPEGDLSVSPDGSPRAWRPGASVLARGVPVHPVAHHDSRTLGSGEDMVRSIAVGVTRLAGPQGIRVYAGEPVLPEAVDGLDRAQRQAVLEAGLRQAWETARSGVLPVS